MRHVAITLALLAAILLVLADRITSPIAARACTASAAIAALAAIILGIVVVRRRHHKRP